MKKRTFKQTDNGEASIINAVNESHAQGTIDEEKLHHGKRKQTSSKALLENGIQPARN